MARTGRLTQYLMPAALVLVAAVLALTGYAMLSGDDFTPDSGKAGASATATASPSAGYAPPPDWTEPDRWAALPRGERTDARGMEVGFPRTTEGAVAMMAASNSTRLEGAYDNHQAQLRLFDSYLIAADRTETNREAVELAGIEADKQVRRTLGLPTGSDLPPGAYVRTHVVGFKVISQSPTEVSAWLLSRVTMKAGETQRETGSYMRSVVAVQWDGDWKTSLAAYTRAMTAGTPQPEIVAPGDPAFNSSAWTAIREAS
ncbi:hypothetical protein GCM10020367_69060 [Streptomyces sannanensis]|uniref:Integral membrane protein n=1 Tax=Streptomyces sannanensis TaxID=285536 RepID=A0ABP6SNA9_9ACTN